MILIEYDWRSQFDLDSTGVIQYYDQLISHFFIVFFYKKKMQYDQLIKKLTIQLIRTCGQSFSV